MKKTVQIDSALLKQAKQAVGATTHAETIRLGLEALVRHAAYQRLAEMRGSEPMRRTCHATGSRQPPDGGLAC